MFAARMPRPSSARRVSCRSRGRRLRLDDLWRLEDRTLLSTSTPINGTTWTPMGPAGITTSATYGSFVGVPGPATGRITSVTGDPSNVNILYLAASGGGVWKSTNAGTSWTPLTDGQATLVMGSIAVAPSNGNVIYAGTGEDNDSADSFYGRGLLKSTDGGSTWTLITGPSNAFDRKAIGAIAISPTDPNTVFISVGYPGVGGTYGNTGIWKTTNGGTTWTNTTTSITSGNSWTDVVLDPTNPSIVYAALGESYGVADNGVYKSTDGGSTWAAAGNFPIGTANGDIALAISKTNPSVLVASVANPGTGATKYLLKSTDAGATWVNQNAPNYMNTQGWYNNAVAIDPNDANVIYAGGCTNYVFSGGGYRYTVIISRNGGTTWSDLTLDAAGDSIHTDVHAFGFDANGRLLNGNDGGIWRLDNKTAGSENWVNLNNSLQITQFTGVSLHPTSTNIMYGGSQDNGTEKFDDSTTWTMIRGGDGGYTKVDPSNGNIVYHTYTNSSLERSTNGGTTWSAANAGLPNDGNFYSYYTLAPSTPTTLYFCAGGLYKSTNSGSSWSLLTTPGSGDFDWVAVAPSNSNVVYATRGGAFAGTSTVMYSTNGGTTFTAVSSAQLGGSGHVSSIFVDPTNSAVAYATINTFGGGRVFKTTDTGATWTNITGNLPADPAWSFTIDTRASVNRMFIGTDTGVYSATIGSTTWSKYGTGLPNVQAKTLELNPTTNILVVGTYGRGVFQIVPMPTTVASVTSSTPNGLYGTGQVISIQVNFSTNVTVTGSPTLALNTTGGPAGVATYASGSGTSTLTFTYTVQAGQSSTDLDYASTSALTGGTLKDPNGHLVTRTLAAPGSAGSLGFNKDLVIGVAAVTLNGLTANGLTTLSLDYTISGGSAPSFQLNFYRSLGIAPVGGDPLLSTVTISNPSDLTVGNHVVNIAIGTGAGQAALPGTGVGSPEVDADYRIFAYNTTTAGYVALFGVYHPVGGDVFVQGGVSADTVSVAAGTVNVTFNGTPYNYTAPDVSRIRIRTHGGADTLNIGAAITRFAYVWAGADSDTLTTGAANLTYDGGAGGNGVTINGSGASETATITTTSATLVGAGFNLGTTSVSTIVYNGGSLATAYLYDSAGNDTFTSSPSVATQTGSGYSQTVNGAAAVYAFASTGTDAATFTGSASPNTFVGTPEVAYLLGPGFYDQAYHYDTVIANGVGGNDTAYFYDSAGNDLFNSTPTWASLTITGVYAVTVNNFYAVTAVATAGGTDSATMIGSAGNDLFVSTPAVAYINGVGFQDQVQGFDSVSALSGGGSDTAYFYDSAGNDTFNATSTLATMLSPGYAASAATFASVTAFHSTGTDSATLAGTIAADTLVGTSGIATLTGPGYYEAAVGFNSVTAASGGGPDAAYFYGSPGDDTFTANPTSATFSGAGFSVTANSFASTLAFLASAGTDTATLTGSASADTFYANSAYAYLSGPGFNNQASGFDWVQAYGSAADNAYIYDPAGNDTVTANPTVLTMTGAGYTVTANSFPQVTVFGNVADAGNVAALTGSAGNETFNAAPNQVQMIGAGFNYTISHYRTVSANGNGGNDSATLTDAALDGLYTGITNQGVLTGGTGATAYSLTVVDFDTVTIDGQNSSNNKKKLTPPLSYTLIELGTWIPV